MSDQTSPNAFVEASELVRYDVTQTPFVITGFPWMKTNGNWNRVPESIMERLLGKLAWVAPQPSGGMIRFRTDSSRIRLHVQFERAEKSATVTPAALSGFCLYEGVGKSRSFHALLAPDEPLLEYVVEKVVGGQEEREWTLYTPLQNPLRSVEIGLESEARLSAPTPFTIARPILFYGSSITCGFCASRPSLTYPARICRALDAPLVNFGFGGNARGDTIIAETIALLDLSCLVLDYDHNTPSVEHLQSTHRAFFEIIRQVHPRLPIVIVTAPSYHAAPEYYERRRRVIWETFQFAQNRGDDRVWFVDGQTFFPFDGWQECTVDKLHPNDLGFDRMARALLPVVREALA